MYGIYKTKTHDTTLMYVCMYVGLYGVWLNIYIYIGKIQAKNENTPANIFKENAKPTHISQ